MYSPLDEVKVPEIPSAYLFVDELDDDADSLSLPPCRPILRREHAHDDAQTFFDSFFDVHEPYDPVSVEPDYYDTIETDDLFCYEDF
jgi:hypothetical protein